MIKKKSIISVILVAMAMMAMAFGDGKKEIQTNPMRMLIPLYIYPSTTAYAPVVNANIAGNIDVILNPSNGVGLSKSSAYVAGVNQLVAGNVGVYGYVYTSYGSRSLGIVKAEIDNWKLWYGVSGIFLDEASNSPSQLSYYSDLYSYVHSKGMSVILNPGTNTSEPYVNIAEANVIYENVPTVSLNIPSWSTLYPSSEFGALQYGASLIQMRAFIEEAKTKNMGRIFVTNDTLPNPWNSLPPYLAEEASLLADGVVSSTVTSSPTSIVGGTSPTATQTPTSTSPINGIKFAVIGDYGSGNGNELAVANMVKSWSPDFIITTGDNCYGSMSIDSGIGKYYSEYIGNYTGAYGTGSSINRFFPTIGNHDYADCGGINSYLNYFTLPNNEYYYDFVKGNVHFFTFDHYSHGGTNQANETGNWLKAGLAASTSEFNVVYFHASPYTSGTGHGSYTPMQWPFAAWGADVVISGHEHSYERLIENGITYFVNGSGGQNLYSMGNGISGSQVRYNAVHGAQLITVNNGVFNSKFYNKLGVLIDDYSLTTTGVTPPPSPPTNTSTRTPTPINTPTQTFVPTVTSTQTPTVMVTNTPILPISPTPTATFTCVLYPTYEICSRPR